MEIRHYKFDRITLNPEVCFGKPCIRGMRMPVASVLGYLGSGMAIKEILKSWPELEADDIYQALAYASWAMDESVLSIPATVAG
jgi:uncharacterized protein (DUF433 family)